MMLNCTRRARAAIAPIALRRMDTAATGGASTTPAEKPDHAVPRLLDDHSADAFGPGEARPCVRDAQSPAAARQRTVAVSLTPARDEMSSKPAAAPMLKPRTAIARRKDARGKSARPKP